MLRCESKRRWSTSAVWSEAAQRLSQQTDIYVLLPINCNLFPLNSPPSVSLLFISFSFFLCSYHRFPAPSLYVSSSSSSSLASLPPPSPSSQFSPSYLIQSSVFPLCLQPFSSSLCPHPHFPSFFPIFRSSCGSVPSPPLHTFPFIPTSFSPPLPPSFFFSFSQQSPAVLQSPLLLLIKLREIGCPRPNNP